MHYDIVIIAEPQGCGLSRRAMMRLHPSIGPICLRLLNRRSERPYDVRGRGKIPYNGPMFSCQAFHSDRWWQETIDCDQLGAFRGQHEWCLVEHGKHFS
jgi:hypothetical protein